MSDKAVFFYGFYQTDLEDTSWEKAYERLDEEKDKRLRLFGIGLDYFLQNGETGFYFYIRKTRVQTTSVEPINPFDMQVDRAWEGLLKGVAKSLEIRLHQGRAGWYLLIDDTTSF